MFEISRTGSKSMIERIKLMPKAMPWGVKLAVIFLLICYIALLFLWPEAWLILTFIIGLGAAIDRIIEYNESGR
jgi:uncharacterized membrane protein